MEFLTSFLQFTLRTAIVICLGWLVKLCWKEWKFYKKGSKIPGPQGYPFIGNAGIFLGASSSDCFVYSMNIFKQYPNICRLWLGPKLIVGVSKPEYLEILLNHPQCHEKDPMYREIMKFVGNGLNVAPVDIWKRHRKLINPTFNQKILDSFVEVFNDKAKALKDNLLKKLNGRSFDVFPIINATSVDIICETTMGIKLNAQDSTDYGHWLDKVLAIGSMKFYKVWYRSDLIFRFSKYKKIEDEVVYKLKNFTRKVVLDKKNLFREKKKQLKLEYSENTPKTRNCFLDHLLDLCDKGSELTDQDVNDEVTAMTGAGSDTTATSLAFFLLNIGMNPDVQRKVYEEIIDVVGLDREVTPKNLSHLHYLERCIKESHRMFATIPVILKRPTVDIDLGDWVVPADCTLVIPIYHIHRYEGFWNDPTKFDPDRFLPDEIAKRHPYSYLPFSLGPRNCIGWKFAMMSMKTTLVTIVRNFIVKTEYKSPEEVTLEIQVVLRPTHGFKLSLERRI